MITKNLIGLESKKIQPLWLPGGYSLVRVRDDDVARLLREHAVNPADAPLALRELAALPAVIPDDADLHSMLIRAYEAWIKNAEGDVASARRALDALRLEREPGEWMTLSEAARILSARWGVGHHVALLRLRRLIERGKVRSAHDPRARNPQRARRVARRDVDALVT
jgi:hypothetical protein